MLCYLDTSIIHQLDEGNFGKIRQKPQENIQSIYNNTPQYLQHYSICQICIQSDWSRAGTYNETDGTSRNGRVDQIKVFFFKKKSFSFLFLLGQPLPEIMMTPLLLRRSCSRNFSVVDSLRASILSSSFLTADATSSDMLKILGLEELSWLHTGQ